MKGKFFFSLTIAAVAFAVVLGFSAIDKARAVPGIGDEGYNWFSSEHVNLFGYDAAHNYATGQRDRDVKPPDEAYQEFPDSYHP